MSCICAKATDEWHGWECSITGGACMYLSPNQDQCADDYGEVEHTKAWKDKHAKKDETVTSFIDYYKELRTLITENAALPLIFMAADDCNNPDWAWAIATAKAKKGIYLDTQGPNEEKIYSSKEELQEEIEEYISDLHIDWNYQKVQEAAEEEMKAYEDKWIEVIYIYVDAY